MIDMGYDFDRSTRTGSTSMRPTKLPVVRERVRQRRQHVLRASARPGFGVKATSRRPSGDLKTTFEFEMFGVGVDAGQTTFRLRHAYGELGKFGAGQTWSPFMDIDVFPNSIEYWGPNGMVFFRNVQVRWMPIQGDSRVTIALERPGASGTPGAYAGRVELAERHAALPAAGSVRASTATARNVGLRRAGGHRALHRVGRPRRPAPRPLSGERDRLGRQPQLQHQARQQRRPASSQVVYGEGIENYMNDAPAPTSASRSRPADPSRRSRAWRCRSSACVAFVDLTWNDDSARARSATRVVDIDNSDGQARRRVSRSASTRSPTCSTTRSRP